MKHLGDITKISGYDAPIVDCIIGGSPCQDLSIAGKRAGLEGERSGLFMEQIRIVKEMRERDRSNGRSGVDVRPRYMVWENVPGAFSSGKPKGADFSAVIEECIKVSEPEAPGVSVPKKGWPTSGCFYDEMGNWSVAWRVLDAQFWGVPQRRRRIALVADFGGQSAPEILFVRKSLSWHTAESGTPGQGFAAGAETSPDGTGGTATVLCLQGNGIDRADTAGCNGKGWREDVCYTLNTIDRPAVLDMSHACDVIRECGETVPSLQARMGTGGNQVPLVFRQNGFGDYKPDGIGSTCKRRDAKGATDLIVTAVDCRNGTENTEVNGTLQAKSSGGQSVNLQNIVRVNNRVRRITPLECERLQGYPDGWTDIGDWFDSYGRKHKESDTPRYKAAGNSIALPPWKWVLKRLCACYERDATMASLFDGIGGFPYIWEQLNGKGSCLWASEIEEFPIAVTKMRFGGDAI